MIIDKVLTVDTGLTTAWAYWRGNGYPLVGEINCPRKLSMQERFEFLTRQFDYVLDNMKPETVLLEMPELWEGSVKSHAAAVRGDTFTLALLVGGYSLKATQRNIQFELLTAREWKGQLTKEATAWRVMQINGREYSSDHITDAVAMGFSRDVAIWNLKKGVSTK